MLPRIRAVAIPDPIRPPPITATFLTARGFSPISVTLDCTLCKEYMNKAFRCVGKNELVKHLDLLKRKKTIF
ncbi:hypothetical protein HanRHA438_Chr10g0476981 [Helianthus annuus]|nr:hypothetical protein HanRHA438_Chr10g0476981 [Helianthus annuus]